MHTKTANRIISSVILFAWMFGICFMRNSSPAKSAVIALVATLIWFGLTFLPNLSLCKSICNLNQKIWNKTDEIISEATLFFNIWLISFFVFILAWLAFFPGILGYDTPLQYAMYLGKVPFDSAQQPILHTLFIGSLITLGHALFHSYNAGLAIVTAIQGLFITHCIASICIFLKRRMVSPLIILAGLVLTFLNPFIQVLNCNITKDVLFGVFLTEFVMAYLDLAEDNSRKGSLIKTIIFGILLCLFRNGLVHAVFVMLIVALIARQKKKQLYIALVSVIAVVHLFSFVADSAFGIKKSPLREFLAVPIQQLTHVVTASEAGADVVITDDEKNTFYAFIPEYGRLSEVYESDTADGPKALVNDDYLRGHLSEFLKLYFSVGLKNTADYVQTWRILEASYFDINDSEYKQLMLFRPISEYLSIDEYDFKSIDTPLKKYKKYLSEKIDIDIPIVFEPIVSFTVLGLLFAAVIAFGKRKTVAVIFLLLTYLAGILAGPVALVRYAYPLMLMLPLLIGLFTNSFKNEENLP